MRTSDKVKTDSILTKTFDKQIFDTKHDEIVLWLYNALKNHGERFAKSIDLQKTLNTYYYCKRDYLNICKYKGIEVSIESPIYKNGYKGPIICGFADICFKIKYVYFNSDEFIENKIKNKKYGETENDIKRCYSGEQSFDLIGHVEVKSHINVGETIRQINYYRHQSMGESYWWVCASGAKYKEIFEEQGIGYIEAKV